MIAAMIINSQRFTNPAEASRMNIERADFCWAGYYDFVTR
jgi:hypothetical protein